MTNSELIVEAFGKAGLELTLEKGEKLAALSDFMLEYNKSVNLTRITDFSEVVEKHFVDSVLPFSLLEIPEKSSFIDVGTGAGFPSLPLLIWRDDLKGTLCDSLQKRCVYLEKVCEKLGIRAEIVHARAEELGRERREKYDFSTARAVSALPVLTEFCLPFVKKGGRFIALKTFNEDVDLAKNAIKTLGGELEKTVDYKLPGGDDRRLVVVKKISQTPTKYPRSFANISKKPL